MDLAVRRRFLRAVDQTRAGMAPGRARDALSSVLDYLAGSGEPAWADLPWRFFREGLDIVPLLLTPRDDEAEAALLWYRAGATVPFHFHTGDEHVFVLHGSQEDEAGNYPSGTTMLNPEGTSHSVASPDGCIVGILWEKPIRFP
jgi:anti-sigma factor ChrR (cupin superfamily)